MFDFFSKIKVKKVSEMIQNRKKYSQSSLQNNNKDINQKQLGSDSRKFEINDYLKKNHTITNKFHFL